MVQKKNTGVSTKKDRSKKVSSKDKINVGKQVDSKEKLSGIAAQEKELSALADVTENIEAGARIVGEKTTEIISDLAGVTSQVAGTVFESFKKGVTDAYEAGSKMVGSFSDTAHDYVEKYNYHREVKKLIEEQNALYKNLGVFIYEKSKASRTTLETSFGENEVKALLKSIEIKESEIVKLGQELDKAER